LWNKPAIVIPRRIRNDERSGSALASPKVVMAGLVPAMTTY